MKKVFQPFCIFLLLSSCVSTKKNTITPETNIKELKLINVYTIDHNLSFKQTTVGGLSGIDYDKQNNCYYIISDDRSAINPARFYKATINISSKGIDTVIFTDVQFLHQKNGDTYPNSKQNILQTPDPESIRLNPKTKQLVWSSEGERIVNNKDTVLNNPSITTINENGDWLNEYVLPQNVNMSYLQKGPRTNGVFEGLCFDKQYKKLYASIELPLQQDAAEPDTIENNAITRILAFDVKTKKCIAQYAYKLEKVAYAPKPSNKFKMNGISEIFWLGENKLLVMERSFSTGVFSNTIKLFITDLSKATNIINNPSLKENSNYTLAKKTLLLNTDDLKMFIDNVEGITYGPTLANGHQSLILIVDNNFSAMEQSQVFLFDITE